MTIRPFLLRGAAVAACALALAGCGQLRPQNKENFYQASLSGSSEVPPVDSAGTGQAEVQHNENTNVIRWKVTYSGLSGPVTGAHIHGPAAPGQNAGIVVPFSGNLMAQPIEGQAQITPEQARQLAAGQWYVNLHTARNPPGEIRGQLLPRR
jgi:hypothetical protein